LPKDFINLLHQQCLLGDQKGMEATISQEKSLNDHTNKELKQLIFNFQFDIIIKLITPYLEPV